MKRFYKIAGIEFEISIPKRHCYDDENILKEFVYEDVESPHKFSFEIVDELKEPEGELKLNSSGVKIYVNNDDQQRYIGSVEKGWQEAYIRAFHCGKNHKIQVKKGGYRNNIGVKTVLNSLGMEHLILEKQGVILHASFIENNGKAILFTAPSGTGKSTQAELWKEYRNAKIINGDRAVIRLIDGKLYACGIPFAGSSTYCKNRTLPIEAIVYLGQAPETEIRRFTNIEAFRRVWEGCTVNTWNQYDVAKAFDIVQNIVSQVPVFYLQCTPNKSAIETLEKELERIREIKKGAEGDK